MNSNFSTIENGILEKENSVNDPTDITNDVSVKEFPSDYWLYQKYPIPFWP